MPLLAAADRLDRHDICTQVSEMLDTYRTHQEMIETDNANSVKKGHGISGFCKRLHT